MNLSQIPKAWEHFKSWPTKSKDYPLVFKMKMRGQTYFCAEDKDGKVWQRQCPAALQELTGITKTLMRQIEKA